jgi:putative transposase
VSANRADHTVKMMCEVLKLSRTGYYKWLNRGESKRERRDHELIDHILKIHRETRGIYGAPRIHTELRANGINVGKKRVARLMREVGVCGVTRRKKWRTTIRDPKARPAPDLVEREFQADKADQLWVADITEIPTRSAKFYLAAIIDVWSRKVVGWSMSPAI